MKTDDVLTNEVIVNGPMAIEHFIVCSVTNSGDVIGERIKPDIGDVLVIPRQLNAPRKTIATDTEIKKSLLDKSNDFVHAVVRNNAVGMIAIPLQKSISVAR